VSVQEFPEHLEDAVSQHEAAYRRVLGALRGLILRGELREGDRLPSVRGIVAQYGVSSGTASRAISALAAEGVVVARHGSGVYVRRFRAIRRSSPGRLSRNLWGTGQRISDADIPERALVSNIEVGETAAPEWAAEALGIGADSPVVFRSRRYVVDDKAVQLATSYYPVDLARGTRITYTDTGPGGSYAVLAELGHAPASFTEYLLARMPRPDEAAQLDLPGGTPVIEITRHAFEVGGRCVEVNRMILDGSAYLLDYSFSA
jgi:GntR family transcriptional regulator